MKKHFLTVAILSAVCISNLGIVAQASSTYTNVSDSQIETRTNIYEWRYKMENGKLYRRLFNRSTGEWVGDWELVSQK